MRSSRRARFAASLRITWLALVVTLGAIGQTAIAQSAVAESPAAAVPARGGMVVSVSPEASDAGLAALRQGGNAVDAAVTTAFVLAVTWPEAGNIGGGGFMMVHSPASEPVCVEYRETAPSAAGRDTFVSDSRQVGHKVVGVPGSVRGLALAHQRFGKLPWKDVVQPAVRLAEDGFALSGTLAPSLNRLVSANPEFAELGHVYGKPGKDAAWREGDIFRQPDLAWSLRQIAEDGPDAFYRGQIAERIVKEMQAGDGLITMQDLAGYQAHVRKPVHGTYRGYDIYGSPPPSSGGTALVEMLNILENFELRQYGRHSSQTMHLVIEAMRRAYCDRARYLGDPDFVDIPKHLTTKSYAAKLAKQIDPLKATPSETLAPEIQLAGEGSSTTHFSVIDERGMAVANTTTLQNSYGSRVVVRGGGFLLNNEMTDFNWKPGHTSTSGAIGTEANLIAPGKRMLSSQSPTVVCRDGKVVLVTGSPGGRTIPNTVLCVVLNVLEFGMDARAAVDAPRLHHQWLPDVVRFEGAEDPAHAEAVGRLREMGHNVSQRGGRQGDAHSIGVVDGVYQGAADQRRTHGKAAGY